MASNLKFQFQVFMISMISIVYSNKIHAQGFLKKLKEKVTQKIDSTVSNKTDKILGNSSNTNQSTKSDNSGKAQANFTDFSNLSANFDFATYVDNHKGLLPICLATSNPKYILDKTDGTKRFWDVSIDNINHERSYLNIIAVGHCDLSAKEVFELYNKNLESIFFGKLSDLASKNEEGKIVFQVGHSYKFVSNQSYYITWMFTSYLDCIENSTYHFTMQSSKNNILDGTVIYGIVKDECGDIYMFEQAKKIKDEVWSIEQSDRLLAHYELCGKMAIKFKDVATQYCFASTDKKLSAKTHFIGEKWGGGIVFYVDESRQHGLIASLKDQNENEDDVNWGDAPKIAKAYVDAEKHNDWRLPTFRELVKLCRQKEFVGGLDTKMYWSSSEGNNPSSGLGVNFYNCKDDPNVGTPKEVRLNIRAIREF